MRSDVLRTTAVLLLSLLPLLCHLVPFLKNGQFSAYEDAYFFGLPRFVFASDSYRRGDTLQWLPTSGCGISLYGEGAGGMMLPTTQLFCRLFNGSFAYFLDVIAAQLTAFTGVFLLLRNRNSTIAISLVAASIYAFSPMGLAIRTSMIWVYAAFPLLIAGIESAITDTPQRYTFAMTGSGTLIILLSGHPVLVVYTSMIATIHLCSTILNGNKIGRSTLSTLKRISSGVITAIIASLPLWIPVIAQYSFSARTTLAKTYADPLNTVHLSPDWIGVFLRPFYQPWFSVSHWQEFTRLPTFVAFTTLVGFVVSIRRRRFLEPALLILVILIASGPWTPLWSLIHSFPVLRHFRFPFRWLFFLPLYAAILSANGMNWLKQRKGQFGPRLLSVISLVILFIAYPYMRMPTSDEVRWLQLVALLGTAVGLFTLTFASLRRIAVSIGVCSTVLAMLGWGVAHQNDPSNVYQLPKFPKELEPIDANYRVTLGHGWYYPWVDHPVAAAVVPDITVSSGLRSPQYSGSNVPYWTIEVQERLHRYFGGDDSLENFARICAIRTVLSRHPLTTRQLRLLRVLPEGTFMYELVAPTPRLYLSKSAIVSRTDEDTLRFLEQHADLSAIIAITRDHNDLEEDRQEEQTVLTSEGDLTASPVIVSESNGRVQIMLSEHLKRPAWLVLADSYYPGWRCKVDGVDARIFRANFANRAVLLSAGAKNVELSYHPLFSDHWGMIPSLVLLGMRCSLVRLR